MRTRSRHVGPARVRAFGYATVPSTTAAGSVAARAQQTEIAGACERFGLDLVDVVRDAQEAEDRPGLVSVLERIETGEASCLVVSGLDRLSGRVADFASVVDRLEKTGVRLIALDVGLDTATAPGQLAVTRRPPRPLPWIPEPEPEPEPVAAELEPEPVEPEPEPAEPEPEPVAADLEPEPEPEPAEPEPEPEAVEPQPEPEPDAVARAPVAPAPAEPEPAPADPATPESEPEPPRLELVAGPEAPPAEAPPPETPVAPEAVRALGYASTRSAGDEGHNDLDAQRQEIERSCARLRCSLVELVADREPKDGKAFDRPGLSHALERIAAGDAACLVIGSLERVSRSVSELGALVHWLEENGIRLITIDIDLDTASPAGRGTARALASVADMERDRLSERTRKGLAAARAKRHDPGDPAATDWTALRMRIAGMRADGMTLQAIADVLNEEGVPTQRGGAKWRPSSVQTAAGYKRRPRPKGIAHLPRKSPSDPG
jgi:DNA invertase Pin-like site-specific DNA recombinase